MSVRIMDPETGNEVCKLVGHAGIISLDMLPNGHLVTGSQDGTIRVWDTSSATELSRIVGTGPVWDVCVLPNGHFASVSLGLKVIKVWDPETSQAVSQIEYPSCQRFNSIIALSDGRLATTTEANTFQLWDLNHPDKVVSLSNHTEPVLAVVELPNGNIASGSADGTVQVTDPNTMTSICTLKGHLPSVTCLAAMGNGFLVSGAQDRTIRLWDPTTCKEICKLEGHTQEIRALSLLHNGHIVSSSKDKTVKVWIATFRDENSNRQRPGRFRTVSSVCSLPNGRIAVADGTGIVLDLNSGLEVCRLEETFKKKIFSMTLLSNGHILSQCHDGSIMAWDPNTGKAIFSQNDGKSQRAVRPEACNATALLNGLFVLSRHNEVITWDSNTDSQVCKFQGHSSSPIFCLATLPNGYVVSGAQDKTILVWDPSTGTIVHELKGHTWSINTLDVLPNGHLLSGAKDDTMRVWDPLSANEICKLNSQGSATKVRILSNSLFMSLSNWKNCILWVPSNESYSCAVLIPKFNALPCLGNSIQDLTSALLKLRDCAAPLTSQHGECMGSFVSDDVMVLVFSSLIHIVWGSEVSNSISAPLLWKAERCDVFCDDANVFVCTWDQSDFLNMRIFTFPIVVRAL
eukprot:GILI01021931.1.p1 GENE.GILI01021931.1~~GILI01021931.1.p1  ORF type:complete len:702 (+),score=17.73 GILI01021931.1:217-2106(+)